MRMPRHNVPQYMGNAVWDAFGVLKFDSAVGAMLGDPFQYAKSANLDILVRLLKGQETSELVDSFGPAWPLDERYIGFQWSYQTRDRLFTALRRNFNRGYLTRSALWRRLPEPVRRQLEQTTPASLSDEAAVCAATLLMDLDFASRSGADIWLLEAMPDEAWTTSPWNFQPYSAEQTPSFWTNLFAGLGEDHEDPHGVVYTSAYQATANGWYGGNMTTVFAPSDAPWGSGMDRFWLDRGCPGPTPRNWRQQDWFAGYCDRRGWWLDENSRQNADGGELRSPNYKAPAEVDGVIVNPWHEWHLDALNDFHWNQDDLSSQVTPTQWAVFRVPPSQAGGVPMAFVVAPAALSEPVYGVEHRCCPITFSASPPPPWQGTASMRVEGMEISVSDRSTPSDRSLPVWGVLYTCSRSNVLERNLLAHHQTARDREYGCAAARALQDHVSRLDNATRDAVGDATLPNDMLAQLAALEVWSPEATMDIGRDPTTVISPRPRERVCAISLAQLSSSLGSCSV